ncbi:hypothetical protein T484DRAFT_1816082, partial [Baffinella frigidus]
GGALASDLADLVQLRLDKSELQREVADHKEDLAELQLDKSELQREVADHKEDLAEAHRALQDVSSAHDEHLATLHARSADGASAQAEASEAAQKDYETTLSTEHCTLSHAP